MSIESLKAETPTSQHTADLQQQVESLQQQFSASQRELESFMYAISHDLRAPLRSLSGFSQALLEVSSASLDPKAQHYLHRIQQASRKMSQMIDALLALSRISRADIFVRPLDLSQLCNEAADAARARYPGRDIRFEIEPGLTVNGDARLIRQAVDALFDNACKFTASSSPARISVSRFGAASGTGFCVRDNGIGFDMAYAGKLFQPFQRLHADEHVDSQGIGLATVQRVVARHGGQVAAESAPTQGTSIFCTLPS